MTGYHLNHQNWLRESNMLVGMVNIFWVLHVFDIRIPIRSSTD